MSLASFTGATRYCTLAWKERVKKIRDSFIINIPSAPGPLRITLTAPAPEKKTEDNELVIAPHQSEIRQGMRSLRPLVWKNRNAKILNSWGLRRIDDEFFCHTYCQAKEKRPSRFAKTGGARTHHQEYFNWLADIEPSNKTEDSIPYFDEEGNIHWKQALDGDWSEEYLEKEERIYQESLSPELWEEERMFQHYADQDYHDDIIRRFGLFSYLNDELEDLQIEELVNSPFYDPFYDDPMLDPSIYQNPNQQERWAQIA